MTHDPREVGMRLWLMKPEELAVMFHDEYENAAPLFGYKTRDASAVPWSEVPEKNKRLMIHTAERVLERLTR